jgi:2-dehydro-3-deoxyphosphogluconate aldolase / (4S)-4-hydroxy-2-oxoglutarate aldolase
MTETEVFARVAAVRIMAVLMIDRESDALPLAEALWAGGIRGMELTLRTPAALGALRAIKREFPEMLAGAGTVIRPDQVPQVLEAGADFAVAPGMNRRVVEAALTAKLPFAPGICTPSDIEAALEYDRTLLKFFPSEPSGGLAYLRIIAAPYAHLGLRFIPLGGVTPANVETYLREPMVACVGGSWLAPREAMQRGDWASIRATAAEATAVLDQLS